jgi:hypothetical protein
LVVYQVLGDQINEQCDVRDVFDVHFPESKEPAFGDRIHDGAYISEHLRVDHLNR